jgi:DNA-binding GntR family transcriptional regulator
MAAIPGPPRREALTDEAYRTLKQLLMMREIAPGAPLRTVALADRLGVSPTPLREALARLETEGLVTREAMVGYAAARELDRAAFDGLFEVRLLLEPVAARHAAEREPDGRIDQLEAALELMRRAADADDRSSSDARAFIDEDTRFHNVLAEMSGNPALADAIRRLHSQVHLFRVMASGSAMDHVVPEHAAILEAIRRADADAAAHAMTTHIRAARVRSAPYIAGTGA